MKVKEDTRIPLNRCNCLHNLNNHGYVSETEKMPCKVEECKCINYENHTRCRVCNALHFLQLKFGIEKQNIRLNMGYKK